MRLDEFEGDYYFRRRIHPRIQHRDGTFEVIDAELYVLKPKYADLATLRPWDPEFFERRELKFFRRLYKPH